MEPENQRGGGNVLSQEEIEQLLAQTAEQQLKAPLHKPEGQKKQFPKEAVQPYDFRVPVFLSPSELRKLRLQHEEFIKSLAARLSIYLRLEFGLQMSKLETVPYQKFIEGLNTPTHLSLFRVEPLTGICLLDINPRLGLTIVDRLMGGPGHSVNANRDLSEIEVALLEQAVQIIVAEWCHHWARVQELRPVLLGHESNGRYLHTAPEDSILLILAMEARVGDCVEQLQMAFPYTTLEPLIRALNQAQGSAPAQGSAKNAIRPKWNPAFDQVTIPLAAAWPERQLSARQLTQLKVGDVLEWEAQAASQVSLRVGGNNKFIGRIGTKNNKWAIEITSFTPLPPA